MIDWVNLAAQSIWVLGLALIVATTGFEDYARRAAGQPLRATWRALTANSWARAGLLLFAGGMALTSDGWLTAGLWGLLTVYLGWSWWRQPRADADTPSPLVETPTGRQPAASAARRLAGRFLQAEPLWLALLAPLFLFPTPAGNWAFLALPALWLVRRLVRGHFVPPTPLDWPLALLFLMALVSLYATPDPALSAPVIARFVYGVAWYYAIVDWSVPSRSVWAIYGLVGAGAGLAILALLGTSWTSKVPVLQRLAGALPSLLRSLASTGNGFNPNVVAGVLLWILPLQLVLLVAPREGATGSLRYRALARALLFLSSLLTLGVFVLAQSRAALVGLGMGVLALLLAGRWGRRAAVALVGLGVIVLISSGPQRLFDSGTTADSSDTASLGSTLSLQNRAEIWSRAIYGIEDFPFTGMGMGTFRHLLPILYPLPWTSPDTDVGHAHNQFLQAGVDLGIPGLVAYLAVWLSAGALIVQSWWRHPPGWARFVAAGMGAALLSSLVFGMIDSVVFTAKPGILFWAMLGVLVSFWKETIAVSPSHLEGHSA